MARGIFVFPDGLIGSLVNHILRKHLFQSGSNVPEVIFGAGGENLDHQHLVVAVNNESREEVGFGIDDSDGADRSAGNEILSVFPGLADPFLKKCGIDFFRRIKAPDPAPDLRIWRISRRGEIIPGAVLHRNVSAVFRRIPDFGNAFGEDPGMLS